MVTVEGLGRLRHFNYPTELKEAKTPLAQCPRSSLNERSNYLRAETICGKVELASWSEHAVRFACPILWGEEWKAEKKGTTRYLSERLGSHKPSRVVRRAVIGGGRGQTRPAVSVGRAMPRT